MDPQSSTDLIYQAKEDGSAAALKRALQVELGSKKQCNYQSYECPHISLDGYNYCSRHILSDKNAPFRQCNYTFPTNGKRCHLPALRGDKKDIGYCSDHALKATLVKNRQNCKYQPPRTAEVILNSLSHYIKIPTDSQQSDEGGETSVSEDNLELKVSKSADPFDIDAVNLYNAQCDEVLGYCSESDSDVESATMNTVYQDIQADSSDNESIDSEKEDPLKHANVYTAEEVTAIARDKLIRLQSLYIEEYRHLQHLLKEKRRKYLHSLKKEKETCCTIYNQVHDNPKEQRLYKKLKAFNSYHKAHGVEAIFSKRLHDLRAKITEGMLPKPQTITKCLFTEGGVKCGERSLPLARHCRKHILEDVNQVLFRSCGRVRADLECNTPVEAIFDGATCKLHTDIPTIKSYNQTRKDSESDYEEPVENALPALLDQNDLHLSTMGNIKSELSEFTSEIPKMESLPSILFEDSANDTNEEEIENNLLNEAFKLGVDKKPFNIENVDPQQLNSFLSPDQQILENNEMMVVESLQSVEVESQTQIQKYIPVLENNSTMKAKGDLKEILENNLSKLDNGKTSEVESPMTMEIDDFQLDESTDTASETMNETKKEMDCKEEYPE